MIRITRKTDTDGYRLTDGTEIKMEGGSWLDQIGREYTSVAISSTDGSRSIIGFVRRDTLEPETIESLRKTSEGRAYIEYNKRIGGDMIKLSAGYPYEIQSCVDEGHTIEEIYEECISAGITWYELISLYPVDRRKVSDPDVEYERVMW